MPGSGMRMRSLGAVTATEITGLDLAAPLDEGTFAEIEATFDRSGVIVIRDQRITPAQQLAFARRFGEIEIQLPQCQIWPPRPPGNLQDSPTSPRTASRSARVAQARTGTVT